MNYDTLDPYIEARKCRDLKTLLSKDTTTKADNAKLRREQIEKR